MTFKRHIDRLPIIPADAKEHNVICHSASSAAATRPTLGPSTSRGEPPKANIFGVDLAKQQADDANWYAPSMYDISSRTERTSISSSSPTRIAS